MKKITNLTKQIIHLEGFGGIEISEENDGTWQIDLFPRGFENNEDMLNLETCMQSYGDKYFQTLKNVRTKLNTKKELQDY